MNKSFAIIGGDLRIVKLANILSKNNKIYTYGLEKSDELKQNKQIIFCQNLKQAIKDVEIVIGPIPFSNDGKNINTSYSDKQINITELINIIKYEKLIAGAIKPQIYDIANDTIEIIDLMKCEELAILNAITTAEGAIEIAMANTQKMIHGSEILILGFGRIGKILAKKLSALSANVTCAARKKEDIAWIKAYGYKYTNINTLGKNLQNYEIIINTVPHIILTEEKIQYINKQCLLIDLASKPGGIDQDIAKKQEIKLVWALALPGKVAPITSAEFIKDIIYNILKEREEIKNE